MCGVYNWKGKEWRQNSQEVGRQQSRSSLRRTLRGNEKPHCAYTPAGNSQNGDTSSKWTVILLQIKVHYSLAFIIIVTALLCLTIHYHFLHFAIVDDTTFFLPCNKATPWHRGHNCFSFFSGQHGWREREGTGKGRLSPVLCTSYMTTLSSQALLLHLTFSAHLRCVMCFKEEKVNLQEDLTQQVH